VQADLLGLEKDYNDLLNEIGRNRGTVFAMQKLANLQAFKLHKLKEAQTLLESAIAIQGVRPMPCLPPASWIWAIFTCSTTNPGMLPYYTAR
jgi:hypothetical protein